MRKVAEEGACAFYERECLGEGTAVKRTIVCFFSLSVFRESAGLPTKITVYSYTPCPGGIPSPILFAQNVRECGSRHRLGHR